MMTLIIPRKEAPVSGEGTVVIPQPAGDEPVIKNTFFFPDIDPKRVRERMRLEQTVAPARLREAIKSGMAETNAELYEYREQKIAAGFTRLADVPADDIDGESIKVFYYEPPCVRWRPHRFMSVIAAWMPVPRATRRPTALTAPLMNCGGICAGRWHVSRTSRAAS